MNHILTKHGALGLVIAQTICRQLVDAIAFLHGHAVIHRDIQPCNIIVSGSQIQINDDLWWDDELDIDGKLSRMAKECHITLVDFGFTRALEPSDIQSDIGLKKVVEEGNERQADPVGKEQESPINGKDGDFDRINHALDNTVENNSRGRSRWRSDNVDKSVSHEKVRDLSESDRVLVALLHQLSSISDIYKFCLFEQCILL